MEMTASLPKGKTKNKFISMPLFKQSFKSTWVLWLIMALGSAFIFIVVNMTIGSKNIFSNIDMEVVQTYVRDEDLSWLKVLGLLENMGFSLSKVQVMSQVDMNVVLNELVYKIAGVLLPMIFVMVAANKLVAQQVSDGSMAYVLSTPTNRKTVARTQFFYLLISLVAMYLVITVSALLSEFLADIILRNSNPDAVSRFLPLRTILYCVGSFFAMFGILGICFGASCFFNKSSYSIAVGGGICVLSYICTILGLFGHKVFVAFGIGVQAMYSFNYLSLFTLIDTESMSDFAKAIAGQDAAISYNWIWEIGILFVVGAIFSYLGGRYFCKKDLPL